MRIQMLVCRYQHLFEARHEIVPHMFFYIPCGGCVHIHLVTERLVGLIKIGTKIRQPLVLCRQHLLIDTEKDGAIKVELQDH